MTQRLVTGRVLLGMCCLLAAIGCGRAPDDVPPARDGTGRSLKNLMEIGTAFHAYHDAYKQMPPAVVFDQNGQPLYSWRVLLLPLIEQNTIYGQFHFDEPWDSPHNIQFVKRMPTQYAHPNTPADNDQGLTHYQVFAAAATNPDGIRPIFTSYHAPNLRRVHVGKGKETLFGSDTLGIGSIPNGASNTILAAEAKDAVPWTKPADMTYLPKGALPRLGGLAGNTCVVLMADGTALSLDPSRISEQTMRNAITANDNQPLGKDWAP